MFYTLIDNSQVEERRNKMNRFIYEIEVLKNYFIRRGGFTGLNDRESKMYNNLAQAKFKNFNGEPIIDVKAPGGMQTLFYAMIGFPDKQVKGLPFDRIEPYAVFLMNLKENGVKLTNREKIHLENFVEYYGYSSEEEMREVVQPIKFVEYTLSDTLLTAGVFSLMEGRREGEFREELNKRGFKDPYAWIDENYEEVKEILEKLLPPIKLTDDKNKVLIKEGLIIIHEDMKIMWKDLILMTALGLKYRGLYRPQFQLGAYVTERMTGNLMNLHSGILMCDEIHRRKFGLKNILEFWGVSEPFPEVSVTKGYTIYMYYGQGEFYTGSDGNLQSLYCILTPDMNQIVVDDFMLGYIHPHIPSMFYTDDYKSELINNGYLVPCVIKQGVPVPISEAIVGRVPRDGDFSNLTSYNLGLR